MSSGCPARTAEAGTGRRAVLGLLVAALIAVLPVAPAAAQGAAAVAMRPVERPIRRPVSRPPLPETADTAARAAWICGLIADAAWHHRLPPEFLARLIWKESRFDARAISPVGAQGIAQFMPGTARMVGLADPWNPAEAIPAAAFHLADLRHNLGNLGLAAAAYNAGEGRVWSWLTGRRYLPGETVDYVHSITYRPAEWFRDRAREVEHRPLDEGAVFDEGCRKMPVMKTRALYAGAARQPWGAQVAGNVNRGRALASFARYQRRFGGVIGDVEPQVVPQRRARGTRPIYTVQIGAASRAEAQRICARLHRAGGPCIVQRN